MKRTLLILALATLLMGANWTPIPGSDPAYRVHERDGIFRTVDQTTGAETIIGPTEDAPVTATLRVSPNGDGTDGLTWATAYQTLNAALDAASTDGDACTLVLVGPHATYYDIDTTGDPTWSANVVILGTYRKWAPLRNSHASATSILKLTGKASVVNMAFSQAGAVDGLILTQGGSRITSCGFDSGTCNGAVTSIHLDGSAAAMKAPILRDIRIIGHISYTTGIYLNTVTYAELSAVDVHSCLAGLQIINTASDNNFFTGFDFGGCALALDLDAGNSNHFFSVHLHENTLNVDDEVGDHHWSGINGEFPTAIYPADLTGIAVAAGNGAWGADVELKAAAAATKPFKVLSYNLEPSADETTLIRFSADSGTTHYRQDVFSSAKNKAEAGGEGTDYIFNIGTRISASAWSPGAGRTIYVWLEVQEI